MLKLPEDFMTFDELKKEGFLEVKAEKEKGKKVVGIFCSYTPVELIMAAGAYFVSLCGGEDAEMQEAEKHLPKNICPLIKSSYGAALTDSCPYYYFSDIIIGETTCDGKKKMYEYLNELKPTHVMYLPQAQNAPLALEMWRESIYRAKEFIESHLNAEITEKSLRSAIKERNKVRKALLELYEVTTMVPSPVSGYELSSVVEAADFHFTDDDLTEYLQQKTVEFRSRYQPQDPVKPRKKRIMVTGCPIGGAREKVLRTIEELGADVVAFDSCSGPRTQQVLVDEDKDPYTAIAEKYLAINCSVMSPNDGRFRDIKDMIEKYQVDGVVEMVLHACHTFAVEAHRTERFVKETLQLPYTYIETDYSTGDAGQIRTRIGAFLEML